MANQLVQDLIEAGIHFGQRSSGWNPKMKPYIYGKRNGIHIIDIKETIKGLLIAKKFVTKLVTEGKEVCFVGTKRQAKKGEDMMSAKRGGKTGIKNEGEMVLRKPLSVWEQYTQALLFSNEIAYVN